ncbi:MAG: hypothetical protein ABFS42_01935 [Candidatus Krumholzibacteriota bacterium]
MLLVGCSDDDPPITIPEGRISSPDELMVAFVSALEARDIEALASLFDHDTKKFTFKFRDEDVVELSLPTEYLNQGEMIQVWRNVFSGREILNNDGGTAPGVAGLEVNRFQRTTEWCGPECDTDSWGAVAYNLQRVNFRVEFTITSADGHAPLYIDGNLEVWVRPPCGEATSGEACQGYTLYRIEDGSWEYEKEGLVTFGKFINQYFTGEPRAASISGAFSPGAR